MVKTFSHLLLFVTLAWSVENTLIKHNLLSKSKKERGFENFYIVQQRADLHKPVIFFTKEELISQLGF